MKMKLILWAIKFIMGVIALGIGIWYLDESIGGASLTYSSTSQFLRNIGVQDGDIATANGCFLCGYVQDLFAVLGNATENFWNLIINHIWILMSVGFAIFLFIYTGQYLFDAMKETGKLNTSEKKLQFKAWFDKVWRQGARVLIAGVMIGAIGMGGTGTLRAITNITITPVMYIGSELSIIATGAINGATCDPELLADNTANADILNPVMRPMMCMMGSLNTVMLAGAAGGFALMNYAYLGLGGGVIMWLAGLGLVLMFLVLGFDLFFKVLTILFKLIFLIIFIPLLIAAAAFEPVWGPAKGLVNKGFTMLVNSAVKIVTISLKTIILFAVVWYTADICFPGPEDNYSSILPPLLGRANEADMDNTALSVKHVFDVCEEESMDANGELDKETFTICFDREKQAVVSVYPDAFDFMGKGFEFIMLMFGIALLYFYTLAPKIDEFLGKESKEDFDFGGWVKSFGKTVWSSPQKITAFIGKRLGK